MTGCFIQACRTCEAVVDYDCLCYRTGAEPDLFYLTADQWEAWRRGTSPFARPQPDADVRALVEAVEAVIQHKCDQDMGSDPLLGPMGCMLGDQCVCMGWGPPLRTALSSLKQGGE